MKAALFLAEGNIEIIKKDIPKPTGNQVLLKVEYAGICGTDRKIFNGQIACSPVILGHEFSGKVIEIGEDVKDIVMDDVYNVQPNLSCGKCKMCNRNKYSLCKHKYSYGIDINGGFGEYCIVDSSQLYPIPNYMTALEAALIEPVSCCLHGLERCPLQNENVLIIGGGFMGMIFLQLAKLQHLNTHIIEPIEWKREMALSLGADCVYKSISETENTYDNVIEAVGNIGTVKDTFSSVNAGGNILLFGVSSQYLSIPFYPYSVWENELRIIGSRSNGHNHSKAIQIMPKIDVNSLVTHVVKLEHLQNAFKTIKNYIKIVVRM